MAPNLRSGFPRVNRRPAACCPPPVPTRAFTQRSPDPEPGMSLHPLVHRHAFADRSDRFCHEHVAGPWTREPAHRRHSGGARPRGWRVARAGGRGLRARRSSLERRRELVRTGRCGHGVGSRRRDCGASRNGESGSAFPWTAELGDDTRSATPRRPSGSDHRGPRLQWDHRSAPARGVHPAGRSSGRCGTTTS